MRVFKKRNKALKKIHKLIKKGKLQATEVHCAQQPGYVFVNISVILFKKKLYHRPEFMTPHSGLFHIWRPVQDGLVPVASLGVENKAFEIELEEVASQPDSEVKVEVDWTTELPVSVSVPRVHIHSLVVDFSAVSFLDVVAAKSLKLVRYLYCSLLSHCFTAISHDHNIMLTFMSFQIGLLRTQKTTFWIKTFIVQTCAFE